MTSFRELSSKDSFEKSYIKHKNTTDVEQNSIGLWFYWRDFNLKGDIGIVSFIPLKKHNGLLRGYGARDLFCLLWLFSISERTTFYKKMFGKGFCSDHENQQFDSFFASYCFLFFAMLKIWKAKSSSQIGAFF